MAECVAVLKDKSKNQKQIYTPMKNKSHVIAQAKHELSTKRSKKKLHQELTTEFWGTKNIEVSRKEYPLTPRPPVEQKPSKQYTIEKMI